jgi:Uma2 family endonuclease
LITKLELYLVCGVKEYWIADPQNRTVTVYKLDGQDIVENRTFVSGADEFAQSFTFDGLSARLQDIFE